MPLRMADSIESPRITGHPIPQLVLHEPVVGGYVAGNSWHSYFDYAKARPDLVASDRLISVTLTASAVARCLDIEPGGATPPEAPGWFRMSQPHFKEKLWLYTFASAAQAVVNAMSSAGISRDKYLLWIADFDFAENFDVSRFFSGTIDGKQYNDKGAENCDISLIQDYMVGPPPPPPDPNHYKYYDTKKRFILGGMSEQQLVQEYDRLRAMQTPHKHPKGQRLQVLRLYCRLGAARIWTLVHAGHPRKVRWDLYHRGFRRMQLARRAKGVRVTK